MEWLRLLMEFLKEALPTLLAYKAGRNSKEIQQLKDENEKLKKYKEIDDNGEHSSNDAYTAGLWK